MKIDPRLRLLVVGRSISTINGGVLCIIASSLDRCGRKRGEDFTFEMRDINSISKVTRGVLVLTFLARASDSIRRPFYLQL